MLHKKTMVTIPTVVICFWAKYSCEIYTAQIKRGTDNREKREMFISWLIWSNRWTREWPGDRRRFFANGGRFLLSRWYFRKIIKQPKRIAAIPKLVRLGQWITMVFNFSSSGIVMHQFLKLDLSVSLLADLINLEDNTGKIGSEFAFFICFTRFSMSPGSTIRRKVSI